MAIANTRLSVLVALHSGSFSGIDTYAEEIAAAGASAHNDVTLVGLGEKVAAVLRERTGNPRIRIVPTRALPQSALRSAVRQLPTLAVAEMQAELRAALRDLGEWFDVAHLNHPALASSVRPFAARVVVGAWFYPHSARGRIAETWRHTGAAFPRSAGFALKGLSHYWNDRRGYSESDCIVAPTELLAAQLKGLGFKAVVCPPPTQPPRSIGHKRQVNGRAARQTRRITICCGDLSHPRKNVRTGVDAVRRLAAAGFEVELELIGGNSDSLSDTLATLPASVQVCRLGPLPRDQIHLRLMESDVLLVPSLYEEWGYVATEALLAGTPVVACPVYPFTEILKPPMGRCASKAKSGALVEALAQVLEAGADRHEVAAVAAKRFGAQAIGRRLTEIWSGIGSDEPDLAFALSGRS